MTTLESAQSDSGEPESPVARALLARYLNEELSANVVIMYLLIELRSVAAVTTLITSVNAESAAHPLARLTQLITANQPGCQRIAEMLRADVDSDAPALSVDAGIAFCKRLFDWSVQQNQEASVALYSLGNPELLASITTEVVDQMQQWGVLGNDKKALEIGCGIGRFQIALASRLSEICGIDVSAKMIETARQRCAGLNNVQLFECTGIDLAQFQDQHFDLLLAIDSFPYLYQSGMALVQAHFREAARVLKTRGDFLILNFSYCNDVLTDRDEVARLAADTGFEIVINGSAPFRMWDGVAFHLRLRDD